MGEPVWVLIAPLSPQSPNNTQWWWLKYGGPCHPRGRPAWNYWLLIISAIWKEIQLMEVCSLVRSQSDTHIRSPKKKKKVNHHVRPLISYLTTQNIQNWFSYIWTPAWYHHLSLSHPCGRFCNESYQKCLQSEMLASPFAFPVHTLNSSNQAIYFPKDLHISNLHITILLNVLNVLH